MSEPPAPGEHLEVALDLLVAVELVRVGAAAGEDLLGQLPEEHAAVGQSLARLALRQGVERAHARGREQEEVARVAAVDDERVPVTSTGRGQRCDRVGRSFARIPRQRDGGDGRQGLDRAQARRTR
ncbi:MAG: hypothetical protein AUI36_35420 [Cyanobacteria bacterium 13_1_40CM_2_61_4]|nr:MAG: hypothetical protein AUI36_35420 [Cyanobacteria bacterium 13_1_40CM_2_61_4]